MKIFQRKNKEEKKEESREEKQRRCYYCDASQETEALYFLKDISHDLSLEHQTFCKKCVKINEFLQLMYYKSQGEIERMSKIISWVSLFTEVKELNLTKEEIFKFRDIVYSNLIILQKKEEERDKLEADLTRRRKISQIRRILKCKT